MCMWVLRVSRWRNDESSELSLCAGTGISFLGGCRLWCDAGSKVCRLRQPLILSVEVRAGGPWRESRDERSGQDPDRWRSPQPGGGVRPWLCALQQATQPPEPGTVLSQPGPQERPPGGLHAARPDLGCHAGAHRVDVAHGGSLADRRLVRVPGGLCGAGLAAGDGRRVQGALAQLLPGHHQRDPGDPGAGDPGVRRPRQPVTGPSSRRCPPASSASAAGAICSPLTVATLHWVTARSVAVRAPPSIRARSPRTAPGPRSTSFSPPTSTESTPSSSRKSSLPTSPCSTSVWPAFRVLMLGVAPPRMMRSDSSRSSAVSTSVTSAGESSSPHGLWPPKASLDQVLKSMTPVFCASLPSLS